MTIRAAIERALAIEGRESSSAAYQYLLDTIGVSPSSDHDESYFAEAFHYSLALLYGRLGDAERVVAEIEKSNAMPGPGGDRLHETHLVESFEIRRQMLAGRGRGLPTFFIAAQPRAGSASLTQTIAATLDLPRVRLSIGDFGSYALVPRWIDDCCPGGVVLHDHFGASEHNLRALRASGVRDVTVLIRDPRASAASTARMPDWPEEDLQRATFDGFSSLYVPWLDGWLRAADDPESGIEVHWVTYPEIRADMAAVVERVFERLRPLYPALGEFPSASVVVTSANLGKADDDAWRSIVSEEVRGKMWAAIPPAAVDLLHLAP